MRIGPSFNPYTTQTSRAPKSETPAAEVEAPKKKLSAAEVVEQKWAAMRSNPQQRPASLLGTDADGVIHLDGVRWGYDESSPDTKEWQPFFKDAKIDPKDVKDIFIGVEPFAPKGIGGHGHAVIEFNKPFSNSDGEQDNRLVVSIEAWLAPGQKYGIVTGLKKEFGVIHQLGSFSDRVQRQSRKEGRALVLHRLNLTPEQREQFVRNSIADALVDRKGEYYNTLTNSCFETQVQELNKVLPQQHQMHQFTHLLHLPRLATVIPGTAGVVLERARLRTLDSPIEIRPDARLYPKEANVERGTLAKATQHSWWGPGCRIAGAALGASVAGHFGGIAGAVAGGLVTSYAAGVVADQARIINGTVVESPDRYYAPRLQAQLNIVPTTLQDLG